MSLLVQAPQPCSEIELLARLKTLGFGGTGVGEAPGACTPGGLGAAGLLILVGVAVDLFDGFLARLVGAGGVAGVNGPGCDDLVSDGDGVVGLVALEAALFDLFVA